MLATHAPTTDAVAHDIVVQARHRLGLGDGVLESLVLASLEVRLDPTVATMQVALTGTGVARVSANPAFVVDVGVAGTAFVLAHEAFHVLLGHLATPGTRPVDRIAREAVVNHWVLRSGHRALPTRADGTTTGVDPREVHRDYAEALGDAALPYAAFIATDEVCARELARIALPTTGPACDPRDHVADTTQVDDLLDTAVRRAADGDHRLRRQLLDLEAATPDSAVWAQVGVSELRGVAARLGETAFWRHHLRAVVGRVLQPRTDVAYDRKTGWWDASLLATVGIDLPPDTELPLHPVRGARPRRHVAVYLDTSASVPSRVVDQIAATVGPIPDTEVAWHTFDHAVHPFEPGQRLVGGGGTDFAAAVEHATSLDPTPDAVLVLTDGLAPPVRPPTPDRWIWLVLEDGDPWPAEHGMACVPVQLPAPTTPAQA